MRSHPFPKQIHNFENMKVAVFGLGVSGMAATELLVFLNSQVKVVEQGKVENWKHQQQMVEWVKRENCFSQGVSAEEDELAAEALASGELIILSPGIPVDHPLLQKAIAKKIPIWSEIELGHEFADAPIICVTGTNGKTTTVTLLAEMFKHAQIPVFVGGNIGTPFCQYALERVRDNKKVDYIVLEVSSFQLETIHQFHPHVAIITNISLNHEERYRDLESYACAKFRVAKNMGAKETLIYPKDDAYIADWAIAQEMKLVPFNKEIVLHELSSEFDLNSFALKGWHNWENLFCAKKAFEEVQEDLTPVQKTIDTFPGVAHRLEKVITSKPYSVYNDAKSTNSSATLTAVSTMRKDVKEGKNKGREIYLIFGGKKRDEDFVEQGDWDQLFQGLAKILLIGESTEDLHRGLGWKFPMVKCYTLEAAIAEVEKTSFTGILLFSPGFPSFDQFQNYAHRGESFKKLFQS